VNGVANPDSDGATLISFRIEDGFAASGTVPAAFLRGGNWHTGRNEQSIARSFGHDAILDRQGNNSALRNNCKRTAANTLSHQRHYAIFLS
jgi:hypothetical protein